MKKHVLLLSLAIATVCCLSSIHVTTAQAQSNAFIETILHNFIGPPTEGGNPNTLIMDPQGNLFGTAETGGSNNAGAVFELVNNNDGQYTERLLYSFKGAPMDGDRPNQLTLDRHGNLFGTTTAGGSHVESTEGQGAGIVFELTNNRDGTYTEKVLYEFKGPDLDGSFPTSFIKVGKRKFFGTTLRGGSQDLGTVFRLKKQTDGSYKEKIINDFKDPLQGQNPNSLAINRETGNLFGTTQAGGKYAGADGFGFGTAFELIKIHGNKYKQTVIHHFSSSPTDGAFPNKILLGKNGKLFGTTFNGGNNPGPIGLGAGTIFQLAQKANGHYKEKILYHFQGAPTDGNSPNSLIMDRRGDLFGTTDGGGSNLISGTAFELIKVGKGKYVENVIYNFGASLNDGSLPNSLLIDRRTGNFLGTTAAGGSGIFGTVFRLVPPTVGVVAQGTHFVISRNGGDLSQKLPVFYKIQAKKIGSTAANAEDQFVTYEAHTIFKLGETTKKVRLEKLKEIVAKTPGLGFNVVLRLLPSPPTKGLIQAKVQKAYRIDPAAAFASLVLPPILVPTSCSPLLIVP